MKQTRNPDMSRIFFDQRDHSLLRIVNEMRDGGLSDLHDQRRFFHHLHPRGIKEMAESKGLRIAYAVIHLLESLERGQVDNRLNALQALHDEVMCSTEQELQINTARVLIEIMKDLIRAHGNYSRQLELAHDFRLVASGKPRIVRSYLGKYHLLEMPEEWNQLAFDDHVHDANTKGRKSATHLIMDAWIKGIRRLRVIYYNFIRHETAEELMKAAAIMGILVRIGIEYPASFHGRFAQIIWVPRGFADARDFLRFLSLDAVENLMNDGGEISDFQRNHVLAILDQFNRRHRLSINAELEIDLPPLEVAEFLGFVGIGQASLLHLAKYIHTRVLPLLQARTIALRERYKEADHAEKTHIEALVDLMDRFDMGMIHDRFLKPKHNPDVPDITRSDLEGLPQMMRLSPCELIDRLVQLHSGYRITLNLSNMKVEDVLELLYECRGRISRLEIFNLKDYASGKVDHIPPIHELQQSINSGNVIKLKRIILGIIDRLLADPDPAASSRIEKFREILAHIESLKDMYKIRFLKPRVGSDSTEHSAGYYGMGLVVMDSLPPRARKAILDTREMPRLVIPFHVDSTFRLTYDYTEEREGFWNTLVRGIRKIPGLAHFGQPRRREWVAMENSTRMVPRGNIVTLSGIRKDTTNGLFLHPAPHLPDRIKYSWRYLQSTWKNFLKVFIGFVPAFLTFFLAHDWWVLMYLGAFIWFAITGLRNIVQSVIAGGGIRRSSLLRWNDFVSWDRITDSLLFTGFSVPLLDYLVKTLLLNRGLGINTATEPVLLYTIMALVNGVYLTSHNLFRGLPREAAAANFFRSVFSIPVAFGFNMAIGLLLGFFGVAGVNSILQGWAAVISKFASDCVAGFIEGTVDRAKNIRHRMKDYRQKLSQFFDIYARLEMLSTENDVFRQLDRPRQWFESAGEATRDLLKIMIINALDLLYFWMYQPRARTAFGNLLRGMAPDERCVFIKSQEILKMEREISQMFLDGIAGRNFARPLSFYLDQSAEYLEAIENLNASFEDSITCN